MKKLILSSFYVLLLSSSIAYANQFTWTGNNGNSFSDPDNWDGATGSPGSNDTIIIENGANTPILDSDITVYYIQMLSSSVLDLDTFTLTVEGFADMQGGQVLNGELIIRGESAVFNGTEFSCRLNVYADYIDLLYGTFNNPCYFELMGNTTASSFGTCTFLDSVTIANTGSGDWYLGSNQFDGDVILIVSSDGPLYMSQTGETYFNGNLYLNNTGSAPIVFGYEGGASYLADGKVVAIGDSGYVDNDLFLTTLNQAGGQDQQLELTGNSNIFLRACLFDGNINISASGILCSESLFNGDVTMDKTGSENNYWSGSNYFYGITSISNSSPSGSENVLCLSSYDGNIFYNDAEFYSTHGNLLEVDFSEHTDFYGDLFINSSSIQFNKSIFFKGSQSQTIDGSAPVIFDNMTIQKSEDNVNADTTITVGGVLTLNKGKLITNSEHLLVMNAGSSVSGASDSSFVSGPVNKLGNTIFTFPTGKNAVYRSILISAPTNVTDAYTAEYFDSGQHSGENLDSSLAFIDNCNHWQLLRTTGTSNVNVSLTWKSDHCPIADTSYLRIVSWHDYNWDDVGHGTITGNYSSGNMVTLSAMSYFGYYTFAYDTNFINPFQPDEYPIGDGFVTNIGQLLGTDTLTHPEILYYGSANNTNLYLSDSVFSYVFMSGDSVFSVDSSYKYLQMDSLCRIDMRLKGINSSFEIVASDTSQGYKNYFLGYLDTSFVHALTYQEIKYNNIYNGINLLFHNNDQQIFELDSSGIINSINFYYQGADSVKLSGDSILNLYTLFGIKKYKIKGFEFSDSRWSEFDIGFQKTDSIISYLAGAVTRNTPLLLWLIPWNLPYPPLPINPQHHIKWSTSYTAIDSPFNDDFADVHIDAGDNIYIIGNTTNPFWPSQIGPFLTGSIGNTLDATVVKFKSNREREFATFYGGSSGEHGFAISVDNSNNIIFAGTTNSIDLPPACLTCITPFPSRNGLVQDVFLVKLDASGQSTLLSTYYGSSAVDYLSGLTIDNSNNIYISGGCGAALPSFTNPANSFFSDFTANPLGGLSSSHDAFIAKFSSSNNLLWRTHYGSDGNSIGNTNEYIQSLDVDAFGNLYALGSTDCDGVQTYSSPCSTLTSTDFPIVGSNYIHDTPGGIDYFIVKFNTDLQVTWSTLFGGSNPDRIDLYQGTRALGISPVNGDVLITGATWSSVSDGFDIQLLTGAYNDNTFEGVTSNLSDGFIAKFDSNDNLDWCTYYGGNSNDKFNCVAINDLGQFVISGTTSSDDIDILQSNLGAHYQPLINQLTVNNGNADGFMAKFLSNFELDHATYLGGTYYDEIRASSLQPNGSNWISVGLTGSSNFKWQNMIHNGDDYSEGTPPAFAIGDHIPFVFNLYNVTTPLRIQHISDNYESDLSITNNHRIYPNPFSSEVTIYSMTKLDLIRIYDINGKELGCEYSIKELYSRLDLSNYGPGIYLLELVSGTNANRYRIIKTNP